MARIYAPNSIYTGTSASVAFQQGIGETDDPHLIAWFRERGYQVELPEEDPHEKSRAPRKKKGE